MTTTDRHERPLVPPSRRRQPEVGRRPRRRHAAVRARIVAVGLSLASTFGLITSMVVSDTASAGPASTTAAAAQPAPAVQPTQKIVRRVIRRHVVTGSPLIRPQGRGSVTAGGGSTGGGVVGTVPPPPAPRPAPVTTSHGSR